MHYDFTDESAWLYDKDQKIVGIQPVSRDGTFLPVNYNKITVFSISPTKPTKLLFSAKSGLLTETTQDELNPSNHP